jgi:hypothetical protein
VEGIPWIVNQAMRKTSLDGLKICDVLAFVKGLSVTHYEYAVQRSPSRALDSSRAMSHDEQGLSSSSCNVADNDCERHCSAKLCGVQHVEASLSSLSHELNPTTAASTWRDASHSRQYGH